MVRTRDELQLIAQCNLHRSMLSQVPVSISSEYPSIVQPVEAPAASPRKCKRRLSQRQAAEEQQEPSTSGDGEDAEIALNTKGTADAAAKAAGKHAVPEVPMHKRERSGSVFRVMVLCLFPISIPLILGILIYMAQRGKAQNAKYAKMTFDHSWVAAAWEKRRAANGSGAQSESDTKSEATSEGSGGSAVAGSTPATPRGRAPHASKANCTLLKPKSGTDVKHGNPGGVHRVAIRQSLEEATKSEMEDAGDVDVQIDDGEQVGAGQVARVANMRCQLTPGSLPAAAPCSVRHGANAERAAGGAAVDGGCGPSMWGSLWLSASRC